MASLKELLETVGMENLTCQIIHQCVVGAQLRRGGVTEVRFHTREITPTDLAGKMHRTGIIVWMDADKFDSALEEIGGK
ncbi:TPA: hypothetical protein L7V77_001411 [Klebsiella pneumoniae]|nr:hypothetical protein [Klebsiella pneumoniae]